MDSYILRFMAKIMTKDPIQAQRRFVISYYLADDTLNIHEPPIRNSGKIEFLKIIDSFVFFQQQVWKAVNFSNVNE